MFLFRGLSRPGVWEEPFLRALFPFLYYMFPASRVTIPLVSQTYGGEEPHSLSSHHSSVAWVSSPCVPAEGHGQAVVWTWCLVCLVISEVLSGGGSSLLLEGGAEGHFSRRGDGLGVPGCPEPLTARLLF